MASLRIDVVVDEHGGVSRMATKPTATPEQVVALSKMKLVTQEQREALTDLCAVLQRLEALYPDDVLSTTIKKNGLFWFVWGGRRYGMTP